MPPAISSNHTGVQVYLICKYFQQRRVCGFRIVSKDNDDNNGGSFGIFKYLFGSAISPYGYQTEFIDPENEDLNEQKLVDSSTVLPPPADQPNANDQLLQFIAFNILLPIVMILIGICFVLGIVLIVKSYMMAPLKQNLATAIRRRRRVGQAPENNYIPQAELRATSQRMSCSSDRKSLPPPEVLMAARERASQLMMST